MPYIGHDLDDACWGESILFDLSFEESMSAGEHIVTVQSWMAGFASGDADASPDLIIDGAATFDATRSFQRLTFPDGRSTRTRYEVFARVMTNFDNEFVLSSKIYVKPIRLAEQQFRKVSVGESLIHTFDFDNDLAVGEDILSAEWSIAVDADSPNADAAPASRMVGNPVNGRFETHQRLTFATDLLAPVDYLIGATIRTTLGNVMKLFSREKAIPSLVSGAVPGSSPSTFYFLGF